MSKTLRATHAVDVGGIVVEPGQAIPDEADPEVVEQLEADGLLDDDESTSKRSSKRSSSSGE